MSLNELEDSGILRQATKTGIAVHEWERGNVDLAPRLFPVTRKLTDFKFDHAVLLAEAGFRMITTCARADTAAKPHDPV
jgi:hypothetical protein